MTENQLFTILHISDFHFSKRKLRDQEIVVDALIADLQKLCVGHRKPDLIVFSGDLVHAAGIDTHVDAYDFLIDRVSKVTGCSDERIFTAAGNHDVSREGVEKYAAETHAWRSLLGTKDEGAKLNELYEQKAFDAAIEAKFFNYIELDEIIGGSSRQNTRRFTSAFSTVDHIEALNLDVAVFNTAVLSTGGHKDFAEDERNLVVPEYAVMDAIKALTEKSLRIFVTHHPYSSLTEQSSRYLEGEITRHAHLHLFGHMHDPQPKKVTGLNGEVLSNQAGAIFTHRKDYYDGYALITLDRSNGYSETLIRSYFKDRNVFDEGIDVIENGRWWPSNEARQHFRKIASPIDDEKFREHLAVTALDGLLARENVAGGGGDLHSRFVAPPLRRTIIEEGNADEGRVETETPLSFDALVSDDTHRIVYAESEYGRTALLRQVRYRLLTDARDIRFPKLPILIDFEDISSNADDMLRKVRGAAEATPDSNDVESLLKLGHACVMIDDVNFKDRTRLAILRTFVSRYPKTRYILSSLRASATQMNAFIDPEMAVRFEFVEICEFKRNDMRKLLAKEERCTDVEGWLDRLQAEFKEINLPFTAANGSILIEIFSDKYNFTPVNRAVLMEQFIDSSLRKAAIEQSRRETFDYTNKTDLLSHLAAWMAKNDEYTPSKESLRTEMKAYVDTKGLIVDLGDLLEEFLTARIFIGRSDQRLSFRYRGVLEYFIALRMTSDTTFKDWILDENRYLRYVNEIQYYAGKLRNDTALISMVGKRCEQNMLEALYQTGKIDLLQLEQVQLPSVEDDDLDVLERDIAAPPLSQEEKDMELETEFPVDSERRQEVFRPKVDDASDRVLLSLILYSGLLKNMELIADSEKRRHLAILLEGWAGLLVESMRIAPRLAAERRIRVNGALYELHAPQGMSDAALLRHMLLNMPHALIQLLSKTLGTEKLERQLTEPTLDQQDEPKILNLLRAGMVAHLRLDSTPGTVAALVDQLRSNKYLLWSFIVHLNELRRLDGVKESHFKALEAPLAGAIASLKGGSREDRRKETGKQLARLAKERLMLTIKRDQEDKSP